jgi:hypothetical protein
MSGETNRVLNTQEKITMYVKLRDYKKRADDEYKGSMTRVNEAMNKLEGELMEDIIASGGNSLSGKAGTVYIKMQNSASVKDRDEFLRFVFATKNLALLDVRANKQIVRELGAEGTSVPGVTYTEIQQVGVRKGK